MGKIFENFLEIENEVKKIVPNILYKYRNWDNKCHQTILLDNVIWFTHPKDLNDPYDIRTPVKFDYSEVEHPIFFEKLKYHAISTLSSPPDSREFNVICENQLDLIKQNPPQYFEKNYREIRESNIYDIVGVFSLSINCVDETMWAHYGNNSTGFCVGFDSVELLKDLFMQFGFVTYTDEPPLHSFIKDYSDNLNNEMFLKHTKWKNEEEFRIVTLQIKNDEDRAIKINQNAIKEIVLGENISDYNQSEIIKILTTKYNSDVKLFKVISNISSYGFKKVLLNY
jgi:hypothetical protein